MREKLHVLALAIAQRIALENLIYNELKLACGEKPVLSDCEVVIDRGFIEASADDFDTLTIRNSLKAIFCGGPMLALVKVLCIYQRHKLRKIQKAEEA